MGWGRNADFISVHTKIIERKRKKEPNTFTKLNSARQSFLLMNAEHFIYHLEYVFIYLADALSFRSLLMTFSRHTDNEPG